MSSLAVSSRNAIGLSADKKRKRRVRKDHRSGSGALPISEIKGVQFGLFSPDEVRAMGVVNVTNHRLYENHRPAKDGLFDLRMGPANREFQCGTCEESYHKCPGHPGYIDLAVPVYHPLHLTATTKVLFCVCHQCSGLLVLKTEKFLRRMRSMRSGAARLAYIYESLKKKKIRTCGVCQAESKAAVTMPKEEDGKETNKSKDGPEDRKRVAKQIRFTLSTQQTHTGGKQNKTVRGSASMWNQEELTGFSLEPVAAERAKKDPDAIVTDSGCLAIQPRIVQEGPKIIAVWPDVPTLYRFLVTGEVEEEAEDEEEENEMEEKKKADAELMPPPPARARKRARVTGETVKSSADDIEDMDEDVGVDDDKTKSDGDKNAAPDQSEKKAQKKTTTKKTIKKASDATQADVAALLRRSPYTMSDKAKPGAREAFGAGRAHDILKCLSDEDSWLLGFHPEHAHPSWMILTALVVPPPCVRPPIHLPNCKKGLIQDHLTCKLLDIVKKNNVLRKQLHFDNKDWHEQFGELLQWHVATYIDNTDKSRETAKLESGKPIGCIVERFKGKKGRIRGNLMGKRVDFSARSTITPDANLQMDELGVPRSVAQTLTYPESVTPFNIERLQKAVSLGPDEFGGARYIIDEDDLKYDLRFKRDIALQLGWVVERMLRDGDIVLFNRQPSLHKMSMMGHRIKIIPGSTFRLNLAVTAPYNADFDGDEVSVVTVLCFSLYIIYSY